MSFNTGPNQAVSITLDDLCCQFGHGIGGPEDMGGKENKELLIILGFT